MKIQEVSHRKIPSGMQFYTEENGVIFYDRISKRCMVKFRDNRFFYVIDILKDWLDNNPKEKYQSPFDGEIK